MQSKAPTVLLIIALVLFTLITAVYLIFDISIFSTTIGNTLTEDAGEGGTSSDASQEFSNALGEGIAKVFGAVFLIIAPIVAAILYIIPNILSIVGIVITARDKAKGSATSAHTVHIAIFISLLALSVVLVGCGFLFLSFI